MNDQEIRNRLKKVGSIPSLPEVIQKVNQSVADENCGASELGKIIENDQALSSKILKLANSSYYGLSRHIDTISRAVTILGFNTVSNLALTVSTFKIFSSKSKENRMDISGLWSHSLACGIGARLLMGNKHDVNSEKAFMVGILHDIGKVIINMLFQEEQDKVFDLLAGDQRESILNAEREIMGFTHAEIGAIVTGEWNFPQDVVEFIRFHHHPQNVKSSLKIVSSVNIANEIVKAIGLGKSTDPYVMPIAEKSWETLGVKAPDVPEIICSVREGFEAAQEFMNM